MQKASLQNARALPCLDHPPLLLDINTFHTCWRVVKSLGSVEMKAENTTFDMLGCRVDGIEKSLQWCTALEWWLQSQE